MRPKIARLRLGPRRRFTAVKPAQPRSRQSSVASRRLPRPSGGLGVPAAAVALTLLLWAVLAAVPVRGAEEAEPGVLDFYGELVGGRWELTGQWSGGRSFHQVKELVWGLDGRIVKVRTFVADPEDGELLLRSEGIRAPDAATGGWKFFEFDREGSIVQGRMDREGVSLYYEYEHFVGGSLRTLRDAWIRIDAGEYAYQVGVWGEGDWEEVLLTARVRRVGGGGGAAPSLPSPPRPLPG